MKPKTLSHKEAKDDSIADSKVNKTDSNLHKSKKEFIIENPESIKNCSVLKANEDSHKTIIIPKDNLNNNNTNNNDISRKEQSYDTQAFKNLEKSNFIDANNSLNKNIHNHNETSQRQGQSHILKKANECSSILQNENSSLKKNVELSKHIENKAKEAEKIDSKYLEAEPAAYGEFENYESDDNANKNNINIKQLNESKSSNFSHISQHSKNKNLIIMKNESSKTNLKQQSPLASSLSHKKLDTETITHHELKLNKSNDLAIDEYSEKYQGNEDKNNSLGLNNKTKHAKYPNKNSLLKENFILSTKNIMEIKPLDTHPDMKISDNISRIDHIKTENEDKNLSFEKPNKEDIQSFIDNDKEKQFYSKDIYDASIPQQDSARTFEPIINKSIKSSPIKNDKEQNLINFKNKSAENSQALNQSPSKNADFIITFANESAESFQIKYSEFYSHINSELKIAFKVHDNIMDYLKGFNPKVLTALNSKNQIVAICCTQYDSLFDNSLRLYMKNILCLEYQKFEVYALAFLKFIFSNYIAEEIYVDLYYENKNGNFEVNNFILNILKKSLGFKWTKLENKIGERYQKMCIKVKHKGNIYSIPSNNPSLHSGDIKNNLNFSNKNISGISENDNVLNNTQAKILKKYKSNMEIISSSIIKLKDLNRNDPPDPANPKSVALIPANTDSFEKNVNLFLILHSLLHLNQSYDFKVKGELIEKMEFERINVNYYFNRIFSIIFFFKFISIKI